MSPRINNDVLYDIFTTDELKCGSHKITAYLILGVVSFLHINSKYDEYIVSTQDLKRLIGYNPTDKKIDYIIKKNGFLHSRGYIIETRDNISIKKNNKNRIPNVLDEMKDCHTFNIKLFFQCMENPRLGGKAFTIGNYINELDRNFEYGKFGEVRRLARVIPLNHKTVGNCLESLWNENLISRTTFRDREIPLPLTMHLRGKLWWWRDIAMDIHDKCCFVSGKSNNLVVHHVTSFSNIRDFVFNKLNLKYKNIEEYSESELNLINELMEEYHKLSIGVPLEKNIHKLLHMKYGSSPNIENLIEFKLEYNSKL